MNQEEIIQAIESIKKNPILEKEFVDFSYNVSGENIELTFPNIHLNIFFTIPKPSLLYRNRISNFRYQYDDAFIKENSAFIVKEIDLRGLEINNEKFLNTVCEYLNALVVKKFAVNKLNHMITILLLYGQITVCALKNLGINSGIWDDDLLDHDEWQKYFPIRPEDAGYLDACIDEIILLPEALVALFNVAFGENKFHKLVSDVMTKLTYKSMMSDKDNITNYPSLAKRAHFSIQTIFSVGFMRENIHDKLKMRYQ